ncbi:MAG TPA: M20/M25/M40 family metallo-hydrolase [Vicinamibacteria bacterium]|nr:M20/M25/M40 family metallo-hydrolase [Vicinamibacteria bacterium]
MTRYVWALVLVVAQTSLAQERIDEEVIARIKMEGFQRSRLMETLSYLTDVYGPRLTGSPGLDAAASWCVEKLKGWGLASARLESWGEFGRGWSVESYSVEMTAPRYARLSAYPHAWSPSTDGVIEGTPMLVEIGGKEDFDTYRGKLKGRIVLRGLPEPARSRFEAEGKRLDEREMSEATRAIHPGEPRGFWEEADEWDETVAREREIVEFFRDEGIAVLIEPSERDGAIVRVSALGYFLGTDISYFPSFVMAKEHYGPILRILEKDVAATLKISLQASFTDRVEGNNVLADLPGSDAERSDELVMLGAHLDSWHAGTGATDNAAGAAAMMEAVRILEAVGAAPRRTIRLALWTGEEQGYFGSLGYVTRHFGDPETMVLTPEHEKLSAYFNLDNGTGRIRGVYLQGNEAARPILEAFLAPFAYLEAAGLTVLNTGGTDHLPFHALGLPGFQFVQDPIDYDTRTHHTNLDVYENLLEEDLEQAAVIIASVAYHAAMRDERFPRPRLPQPRPEAKKN